MPQGAKKEAVNVHDHRTTGKSASKSVVKKKESQEKKEEGN